MDRPHISRDRNQGDGDFAVHTIENTPGKLTMRSRDPGSWMWAEALELLQNAERLQHQFFRIGVHQGAPRWEPPVDMYQEGGELRLLVALPGVAPQQLEVVLARGLGL